MKAEAFDSNSGTEDGTIETGTLSSSKRWEAFMVSGTMSDIHLMVADAGIQSGNIPVQAPSGSGTYNAAFGSSATYTAATASMPNAVKTTGTAITSANYTGYLSYAKYTTLAVSTNSCLLYTSRCV